MLNKKERVHAAELFVQSVLMKKKSCSSWYTVDAAEILTVLTVSA